MVLFSSTPIKLIQESTDKKAREEANMNNNNKDNGTRGGI